MFFGLHDHVVDVRGSVQCSQVDLTLGVPSDPQYSASETKGVTGRESGKSYVK